MVIYAFNFCFHQQKLVMFWEWQTAFQFWDLESTGFCLNLVMFSNRTPYHSSWRLRRKKISANSYVKSVSKSAAVLGCASMSVHQQVMYTNCSFIPYITGMDQVDPSRRSGLMKTFVAIEALGLSVAQRKAAKDWAAKFCEQKIRRFPFRHGLPPNRRSHGGPNYITYLKNRRY